MRAHNQWIFNWLLQNEQWHSSHERQHARTVQNRKVGKVQGKVGKGNKKVKWVIAGTSLSNNSLQKKKDYFHAFGSLIPGKGNPRTSLKFFRNHFPKITRSVASDHSKCLARKCAFCASVPTLCASFTSHEVTALLTDHTTGILVNYVFVSRSFNFGSTSIMCNANASSHSGAKIQASFV